MSNSLSTLSRNCIIGIEEKLNLLLAMQVSIPATTGLNTWAAKKNHHFFLMDLGKYENEFILELFLN